MTENKTTHSIGFEEGLADSEESAARFDRNPIARRAYWHGWKLGEDVRNGKAVLREDGTVRRMV